MTNSIAIKNLTIACEALSRINSARAAEQLDAIQKLLDDEIGTATMEKYRQVKPNQVKPEPEDEIPF